MIEATKKYGLAVLAAFGLLIAFFFKRKSDQAVQERDNVLVKKEGERLDKEAEALSQEQSKIDERIQTINQTKVVAEELSHKEVEDYWNKKDDKKSN